MILYEGQLLPDEELDKVLDSLWNCCLHTVMHREVIWEKVITACNGVAEKLRNGVYDAIVRQFLEKGAVTSNQVEEVTMLFNEESLRLKYETELGRYRTEIEGDKNGRRVKRIEPLGILFHIAAGNAQGLPFYSVLEGLFAGNVNILKLPSLDDGISIMLLHEMIKEEPSLASYVCVLDVPSTNLSVMKRIADMADGIVVWGGDEAIRAIRSYAEPNTHIISWGHKLSFAYITKEVLSDENMKMELRQLAEHMCETKQTLCSSCQGIFVDTDERKLLEEVGEMYFCLLKEVSRGYKPESIGIRGKNSIALYNAELENQNGEKRIWKENGVSVTVSDDSELELSYMFRNCWIKPLPRGKVVECLKAKKGYLQTAGLLCKEEERSKLTEELIKAGVTRITRIGGMSASVAGDAHDGEYPLRRYCKIVEIE